MRKADMSEAQVEVREELARLLKSAGWDLGEWETLFDNKDISLDPELQAEHSHGDTKETFGWSAERDEISLLIEDANTPSHLFRVPSAGNEIALTDVLIANQDQINTTSFGGPIRSLADIAGVVYWESSMGTIPLKPGENFDPDV